MAKQSDAIARLKLKVFELEATLALSQIRFHAFRDLATTIWESQGVRVHPTDSIPVVFDRMEREAVDIRLADCADTNPAMAGIVRKLAEELFGPLPNTGAEETEDSP